MDDDEPTLRQAMDNMIAAMRANKSVINRARYRGVGDDASELRAAIASVAAAAAVIQGLIGE